MCHPIVLPAYFWGHCPLLQRTVDIYSRVGCNHIVKVPLLRNIVQPFSMTYSFTKFQCQGFAKLVVNAESYETGDVLHAQPNVCLLLEQTNHISIGKSHDNLLHDLNGSFSDEHESNPDDAYTAEKDYKEMQRRRKIGLANQGKTPWNKGRKHSAETRALIKRRTLEALSDPKVRRKMSELPHAPHSEQSKARMASSLRKVWGKRLKWKRLQEKCYLQWAKCIAKEAKGGGLGQEELDWDSYEKIKAEIAHQELQRAADKAKAKEIAKVRAQREAKAKSEKKARLAQKRKEKERKAQTREFRGMPQKKSEEEKKDLADLKASKLKEKLTQINHKSMVNRIASQGGISNGVEPALQVWDLDFIKKEKVRREVSLADQIQAVKQKNAEPAEKEALILSFAFPLKTPNAHPLLLDLALSDCHVIDAYSMRSPCCLSACDYGNPLAAKGGSPGVGTVSPLDMNIYFGQLLQQQKMSTMAIVRFNVRFDLSGIPSLISWNLKPLVTVSHQHCLECLHSSSFQL
ncbi:hypothetical protein ACLOJK_008847 [Asimina triloba]